MQRADGITEIVTFPLPEEISGEQILLRYRVAPEKWRQNPDLIHKQHFFNADQHSGGGVYLWKLMDAAGKWHGDAFRKMVLDTYGSEPSIQYLESVPVGESVSDMVDENPPA